MRTSPLYITITNFDVLCLRQKIMDKLENLGNSQNEVLSRIARLESALL